MKKKSANEDKSDEEYADAAKADVAIEKSAAKKLPATENIKRNSKRKNRVLINYSNDISGMFFKFNMFKSQPAKRRFLCRLCTCIFIPI